MGMSSNNILHKRERSVAEGLKQLFFGYLNGSREQMSVVRKTGGERRSIVERVLWSTLRELQTRPERIDLLPESEDLLFFLREVERGPDLSKGTVIREYRRVKTNKTHCRALGKTCWFEEEISGPEAGISLRHRVVVTRKASTRGLYDFNNLIRSASPANSWQPHHDGPGIYRFPQVLKVPRYR